MGGTGQGMGWNGEGKRKEEGEGKGGEGLQPPSFNSWRRHCPPLHQTSFFRGTSNSFHNQRMPMGSTVAIRVNKKLSWCWHTRATDRSVCVPRLSGASTGIYYAKQAYQSVCASDVGSSAAGWSRALVRSRSRNVVTRCRFTLTASSSWRAWTRWRRRQVELDVRVQQTRLQFAVRSLHDVLLVVFAVVLVSVRTSQLEVNSGYQSISRQLNNRRTRPSTIRTDVWQCECSG